MAIVAGSFLTLISRKQNQKFSLNYTVKANCILHNLQLK